MTKQLSIIVAIADLNAIGVNNDLLVYLPNDLKRFKQITTGHTIIMGRKTFDSLPKGALPNRTNIVVSRNANLKLEGATVVSSIEEAMAICPDNDESFVIGGATIYEAFLPHVQKLYITQIHHLFKDADTFFPEFDMNAWDEESKLAMFDDPKTEFRYSFVNLVRK